MKLTCLILLLFGAGVAVRAQVPLPPKYPRSHLLVDTLTVFTSRMRKVYDDSTLKTGERLFSPDYYNQFFSKWLSYVNFAKDGYPDGNSVLLAPSSSSTRLRTTLARKMSNVVFNAGAEANFNNNIANVFTKKDVTSATSFFSSFSILPNMSRKIRYDVDRGSQNDIDKLVLLDKILASAQKRYQVDYPVDSVAYTQLWDSVTAIKQAGKTPSPKLLVDYYAARDKLSAYGFNENEGFYDAGFFRARIKAVKDSIQQVFDSIALNNDAIVNFKFSWFSGSFTYTRNDYTTYNGNAPFTKRIGDVPFDSLAFNAGFNFLFERTEKYQDHHGTNFWDKKWLRSVYFTANYNVARDVNYAHLNSVNVLGTQTVPGGTDTAYLLQSQNKAINITNIPKVTGWLHTFSVKTIVVLTKSELMGFDVGFNAGYGKLVQPIYSGQLGVLFRFTDSQNQKSKVNFELFLQLPDMADSQHSGQSTWDRKVVGINASIPFNKLFF
jgi:hypothetical protein